MSLIDLFITKFLLALFAPAILVVFLTRVTYHHVIGLLLTLSLVTASVYAGYTHHWVLYVVDAFSLTVGFALAKRMVTKARACETEE